MRNPLLLLGLLLIMLPGLAPAQPAATPATLVEAWLAWETSRQERQQAPFDWAYSHALTHEDARSLNQQHRRLMAELEIMNSRMAQANQAALAGAMKAWEDALADSAVLAARTPRPLGLLDLVSDLRQNPGMRDIHSLGTCQPPTWIETWSLAGVNRLAWQRGMTLDSALEALPPGAIQGIDNVVMITPKGARLQRGIAAWNHQNTAVAPGSRIVVQLPQGGLGGTREGRLINRKLSAYLATRLPGENCMTWETE